MGFLTINKIMKTRLYALIVVALMLVLPATAQKRTTQATLYRNFKPSIITLVDGRKLHQQFTNIFLKNSSLLYLKGEYTMEADMSNVLAVDFDDRSYIKIGQQLAYVVDTLKEGGLYCVELFDKDTYERNLKNNVNISSLDLGEQISYSSVDLNNEEDYKLPVFRHYYFLINGEFVKVHERELNRKLAKGQRTMMKRIISMPDFSWQNEESLKTLLHTLVHE